MIPISKDCGREGALVAAMLALRPPHDDFIAESIRAALRRDLGGVPSPLRWDRYAVCGRLGGGRLGALYEAVDLEASRRVAIRVLQRRVVPSDRLLHFSHPNLVEVYATGVDKKSSRAWVATELVDGVSLPRWIGQQRRSLADVLEVFRGAARGLAAAHIAGVTHGALRPDDILVSHGQAKVANLGLEGNASADDDEAALRGILDHALGRCELLAASAW